MGQSLTVQVFYGAMLPDPEEGPKPRLAQFAVDAIPPGKWSVDREDIDEIRRIPSLGDVDTVRSGVGDWVYPHLAIGASATRVYGGIGPLTVPVTDSKWEATIREALACLEWVEVDYEGDKEIERVVDAPDIAVGWHVAGSYW